MVSRDKSPSLGPPSGLIKRPRVLLALPLRGHCLVVFFLAVSLRDRGSKLVTVSFRLQSRAFSSCWGEGGGGFPAVERKNPPPSLLMVYRLQRATRTLVEVVIFHTSFPVRERSAEPHTFPLPLPLSSISDVSHLFLQVVL